MKRNLKYILLTFLLLGLLFSCSKKNSDNKATGADNKATTKTITIGASPVPHAEILAVIKDDLKKEGYDLVIKEFTDYVTPNDALESRELDANYFQHVPYLETFNKEKGYHLVTALKVHVEPMAMFSKKYKSLSDVKSKSGLSIAIPNDPTNEGRALLLLQEAGLISLADSSNLLSTPEDIKSNPYKLSFREIEAASLPRMLDDVDCAVINGNYAIPAGFDIKRDALVIENASSPYSNVIAVYQGDEKSEKIEALIKVMKNGKVKKFIEDSYKNGEVVCVL